MDAKDLELLFAFGLLVATTLAYPILALLAVRLLGAEVAMRWGRNLLGVCLFHGLLEWWGLSFRGDILDRAILSAGYLALCTLVFGVLFRRFWWPVKLLGVFGLIHIVGVALAGMLFASGFGFLLVQDQVRDGKWNAGGGLLGYELRRYKDASGPGSMKTRYDFRAYRVVPYSPLEWNLLDTSLLDTNEEFRLGEPNLRFQVDDKSDKIRILDSEGRTKEWAW